MIVLYKVNIIVDLPSNKQKYSIHNLKLKMNEFKEKEINSNEQISDMNYSIMTSQPISPNQPLKGHEEDKLPTQRSISTIPMANGQPWIYPSEQMFYNAVIRKNNNTKDEKIKQDIKEIVNIHNYVNEMCWNKIKENEQLLNDNTNKENQININDNKLVRFQGKSQDFTIKALFNHYILGYKLPFDRHDWIINRNGKEIKYIIDFYTGKNNSIYLDIRRDLTLNGIKERILTYYYSKYK